MKIGAHKVRLKEEMSAFKELSNGLVRTRASKEPYEAMTRVHKAELLPQFTIGAFKARHKTREKKIRAFKAEVLRRFETKASKEKNTRRFLCLTQLA